MKRSVVAILIAISGLASLLFAPAWAETPSPAAAPAPALAPAVGTSAATTASIAADPFTGGDAQAGAAKAGVCAACHGPGGVSTNPEWPKLAGQSARYIEGQLQLFKTGLRPSPVMAPQAAPLSPQDMKDLGAYFATQAPSPGVASKEAVAKAEKIYRGGDVKRGLPACSACHGPGGAGNAGAGIPRIGGQHPTYAGNALRQLRALPVEQLANQPGAGNVKIMASVAAKLTDPEIEALASYIAGLQ